MSDKRYPYSVLAVPSKDARPRTEDPISIAVAALASVASAVGGAAAAGTLASLSLSAVLASAAVSALVAGAASLLTPQPETPSPAEIVRTIRQPLSYRQTVYGRTRVNTYLFYADTTNDKNDLHLVLGLAGHEIDAVEEIWFDDQMVWQNGSYTEIEGTRRTRHTYTCTGGGEDRECTSTAYEDFDTWNDYAYFGIHTGTQNQTADSDLVSRSEGWTNQHRLRGTAYIYARLRHSAKRFPRGIPNITAVIRGKKVHDPRSGQTAWSANASLCIRDYLLDSFLGFGAPSGTVNDASFISRANLSDETVPILDSDGADTGETEKRYEIHGTVGADVRYSGAIEGMLTACACKLSYTRGQFHLISGAYESPTATFDDDDFRDTIRLQTRQSRQDLYNGVKGTFRSPADDYVPTEYPSVISDSYALEDGEPIYRDHPLAYTSSSACAQRLAKLQLLQGRAQQVVTMPMSISAFGVSVGDTIQINRDRWGWINKTFEVLNWGFVVLEDGGLGIDIIAKETSPLLWDWTISDETPFAAGRPTWLPDGLSVLPPSQVTTQIVRRVQTDGSTAAFIAVDFVQSPETEQHVIEWSNDGFATTNSVVVRGSHYEIPVPADNWQYLVRAKAVRSDGAESVYVNAQSVRVTPDTTAPPPPANVQLIPGLGSMQIVWDESPARDYAGAQIRRGLTNVFVDSDAVARSGGEEYTDEGLFLGTTYHYWLRSFDRTGNYSTWVGPYSTDTERVQAPDIEGKLESAQIAADAITSSQLASGSVAVEHLGQPVVDQIDAAAQSASADKSAAEAAASAASAAEAAAETARDVAQTARDQSQVARAESQGARDAAQSAKSAAQVAEAGAETARDDAQGSAGAAAVSAATAQSEATDAASSAGAAQTARTAAESSRDQAGSSASAAATSASTAGTHATNAGNSATASDTSRVAAESARDDAQDAETAAGTSASAAASSASSASTSASNAATSATSATNSANNASTDAGSASTSASQAATSATDAAGSASSALASQAVAADTREDVIARSLDPEVTNADAWQLNSFTGESPVHQPPIMNNSGAVLGVGWMYSRHAVPVDTSRVYRLTVRIRQTADPTSFDITPGDRIYCGVAPLDENYQYIQPSSPGGLVYFVRSGQSLSVADGWQTYTATITGEAGTGDSAFRPGTKYVRYVIGANYGSGNGAAEVDQLLWEDVTSETEAQGYASAAASSESAAAASETAAGQSASAAQTSETNAATSAGQASTSATQASNSASTAAGHASSASTSASTAAGSASNASNSASAASTSATNAAASQSAAASSASSASSSANNASTSAGNASTSASQAASSASTATTKANEASSFASVAATTADENQAVNALSRWPTKESWSAGFSGDHPAAITSPLITEVDEGIQASGGSLWLYLREAIPVDTTRTYELSSLIRQTGESSSGAEGNNQRCLPVVRCLDGGKENTLASANRYPSGSTGQMALNTDYSEVGSISGEASSGHGNFAIGTKFIRIGFLFNHSGGDGTQVIKNLTFADVTERDAAEDSASAAATSASLAQIYSDGAGNSATSATNSANTASSQAAAASGSASAADADRAAAANSASAASTSASSASTSASNASSSASAAQSSAVVAQSSAGTASTQAQVATTKAAEASASANSASASETVSLELANSAVKKNADPYLVRGLESLTGTPTGEFPAALVPSSTLLESASSDVNGGSMIRALGYKVLYTRSAIPIDITRKYRFRARVYVSARVASPALLYLGFVNLDGSFTSSHIPSGVNPNSYCLASGINQTVGGSWVEYTVDIDGSVGNNANQFRPQTKYIRLLALLNNNSSNTGNSSFISELSVEDITEAENITSAAVSVESAVRQSEIGGIEAKYAVKVGVGGHVSGFGLISTANNAAPTSEFAVLADRFTIARPDGTGTPKQAFSLGEVNGTTTVVLDGDMLADGSIYANAIHATAINKVQNPATAKDSSGWSSPVVFSGKSTVFGPSPGVRSIRISGTGNHITFSDYFDVDPTKTYKVTAHVYGGDATAGTRFFGLNVVRDDGAASPVNALAHNGTTYGGDTTNPYFWVKTGFVNEVLETYIIGANVSVAEAPLVPSGVSGFRMQYTAARCRLRFLNYYNNGTNTHFWVSHITVTEVDAGLITARRLVAGSIETDKLAAGAVTADKIQVSDLSAVSANLGTIQVGSANIAATIQSANYSPTAGWQINKAGSAIFNDVTVRRQLQVDSGHLDIGNQTLNSGGTITEHGSWFIEATSTALSAWTGLEETYLAEAGFGSGTVVNAIPGTIPDALWGVKATILPLTRWSGNQTLRIKLTLWSKNVQTITGSGSLPRIEWRIYRVT